MKEKIKLNKTRIFDTFNNLSLVVEVSELDLDVIKSFSIKVQLTECADEVHCCNDSVCVVDNISII